MPAASPAGGCLSRRQLRARASQALHDGERNQTGVEAQDEAQTRPTRQRRMPGLLFTRESALGFPNLAGNVGIRACNLPRIGRFEFS
jgi:hypothetical protein